MTLVRLEKEIEEKIRFWETGLKGSRMFIRYGFVGEKSTLSVLPFDTLAEAEKHVKKMTSKKIKEGFHRITQVSNDSASYVPAGIPKIFGDLVLKARKAHFAAPSADRVKWHVNLSDDVSISFDGYPLDEDDVEDVDNENYIVFINLKGSRVSFYVDLEDCKSENPKVNYEYVEERYNDDVLEQLQGTGYNKSKFEAHIYENIAGLLK